MRVCRCKTCAVEERELPAAGSHAWHPCTVSLYMGGTASFNFGPDFEFPPSAEHLDALNLKHPEPIILLQPPKVRAACLLSCLLSYFSGALPLFRAARRTSWCFRCELARARKACARRALIDQVQVHNTGAGAGAGARLCYARCYSRLRRPPGSRGRCTCGGSRWRDPGRKLPPRISCQSACGRHAGWGIRSISVAGAGDCNVRDGQGARACFCTGRRPRVTPCRASCGERSAGD